MLEGFLQRLIDLIIQPIATLLFLVSFVIFAWGVLQLIISSREGNNKNMSTGKRHMLYGLIGMFVMMVSSGIVQTMCLWLEVRCFF
jgi:phosphotransferase system  glucose/maltose/N-acetylglucosamine-specific IIC component